MPQARTPAPPSNVQLCVAVFAMLSLSSAVLIVPYLKCGVCSSICFHASLLLCLHDMPECRLPSVAAAQAGTALRVLMGAVLLLTGVMVATKAYMDRRVAVAARVPAPKAKPGGKRRGR